MQIRVEFEANEEHPLFAGRAVVTMGDRVLRFFRIIRTSGYALQPSIDRAKDRAVDAAVDAANENGMEFRIYDVDHSGIAAIENQAAEMRLNLATLSITIFSTTLVIALALILLVAGDAAHTANKAIGDGSLTNRSQKAVLDSYTAQMGR